MTKWGEFYWISNTIVRKFISYTFHEYNWRYELRQTRQLQRGVYVEIFVIYIGIRPYEFNYNIPIEIVQVCGKP